MTSFKSLLAGPKPKTPGPPSLAPPSLEYKPLIVAYQLDLTVEGNIALGIVPKLIDTLFLAWLIELFKEIEDWTGCLGYVWKSMRERVLDTLTCKSSTPNICHMLTSICTYLGFTDGSCLPSTLIAKCFEGNRSWELMSDSSHLIVITLRYHMTLQTFSHHQRNALRNEGFQKLDIPTKKEYELLQYIGIKNAKPYYNHEKSFEKLLLKLKGPKSPRVRSILHEHIVDRFPPSCPPPPSPQEYDPFLV